MMDLFRFRVDAQTVYGVLYDNCFDFGTFFTIERKQTLIPEGVYQMELQYCPKFRRQLPIISNYQVTKKRGIYICTGNTVADTQGNIIIGKTSSLLDSRVEYSHLAIDQLVKAIRKWNKKGKTATLYVKDAI